MPQPLTSYINTWRSDYIPASGNIWSLGSQLKNAANALKFEFFEQAASALDSAGDNAHVAALAFDVGANNIRDDMYDAMHWIDNNIGDGAELTMDAILEAMWDTDKLRSFHFINYIDAMRASIWNIEIYETHLVEWYRHFSE